VFLVTSLAVLLHMLPIKIVADQASGISTCCVL